MVSFAARRAESGSVLIPHSTTMILLCDDMNSESRVVFFWVPSFIEGVGETGECHLLVEASVH
jgi:hypothetical protein